PALPDRISKLAQSWNSALRWPLSWQRSSLQPVGKDVEIVQVESRQRAMRTGPLAGWPAWLFDAEVAFGRLKNGIHFFVGEKGAALVPNLDHANRLVRAIAETGFAADAGGRVDYYFTAESASMDGAGG